MSNDRDIPPREQRELKRCTQRARGQARYLRQEMTKPEVYLWLRLRRKQASGFVFHRQMPLGEYIADFYCHEARLIVEVDGLIHDRQRWHDHKRDQWMAERGIHVVRFSAAIVLRETDAVAARIVRICRERAEMLSKQRSSPVLADSATPSASAEGDEYDRGDDRARGTPR